MKTSCLRAITSACAFHFAHLKSTFSILHTYFYKTPTSVCLFYTFIQIKYSFLYPHSHRPTPTIHTGITPESTQPTGRKPEKQTQQQDRRTRNQHNPATQSTQPIGWKPEKQTQQQDRCTRNQHNPATQSTQPTWNWHLTLSNKINAFGGDGENKK